MLTICGADQRATAAQRSAGSERRAQTHRPALHKHYPKGGRSCATGFEGRVWAAQPRRALGPARERTSPDPSGAQPKFTSAARRHHLLECVARSAPRSSARGARQAVLADQLCRGRWLPRLSCRELVHSAQQKRRK